MAVIRVCDICGIEIKKDDAQEEFYYIHCKVTRYSIGRGTEDFDLCVDCEREMAKWIRDKVERDRSVGDDTPEKHE